MFKSKCQSKGSKCLEFTIEVLTQLVSYLYNENYTMEVVTFYNENYTILLILQG